MFDQMATQLTKAPTIAQAKAAFAPTKVPAKAKVAKPVKTKVSKTKPDWKSYEDGTIYFRADRNKWVVVIEGAQPAARPTKEGVVTWLAKKHPEIKPLFI